MLALASFALPMRHRHAVLCGTPALLVFSLMTSGALAQGVTAETSPACKLADPVRPIAALADLPQPVRRTLGAIAEKGQPFNAIDVFVPGLPNRRFLRAAQSGDLYFVWYVQGGIFLSTQVSVYRLKAGASEAERLGRQIEMDGRACDLTDDVMNGRSPN